MSDLIDTDMPRKMLLTSREAAKLLSISERSLWTLTKTGRIAVVKIGSSKRYAVNDLQRFIVEQTQFEIAEASTQGDKDN